MSHKQFEFDFSKLSALDYLTVGAATLGDPIKFVEVSATVAAKLANIDLAELPVDELPLLITDFAVAYANQHFDERLR